KCTAAGGLLWVLPVAFVLDLSEAAGLLVTRRASRARALLGGWWAALRGLRATLAARRPVQSARRVGEHDVRALMVRGSSRFRTMLAVRLHTRSRLDLVETSTRTALQDARARLRGAGGVAWVVVLAVI